jgi:hypothetical protein
MLCCWLQAVNKKEQHSANIALFIGAKGVLLARVHDLL